MVTVVYVAVKVTYWKKEKVSGCGMQYMCDSFISWLAGKDKCGKAPQHAGTQTHKPYSRELWGRVIIRFQPGAQIHSSELSA